MPEPFRFAILGCDISYFRFTDSYYKILFSVVYLWIIKLILTLCYLKNSDGMIHGNLILPFYFHLFYTQ